VRFERIIRLTIEHILRIAAHSAIGDFTSPHQTAQDPAITFDQAILK
jgi:hypothetical protein